MDRMDKERRILSNNRGQAIVEYLLLFGLMTLISIGMVKGFGAAMGESVSRLAFTLSQQLSVGTCKVHCFGTDYRNSVGN